MALRSVAKRRALFFSQIRQAAGAARAYAAGEQQVNRCTAVVQGRFAVEWDLQKATA